MSMLTDDWVDLQVPHGGVDPLEVLMGRMLRALQDRAPLVDIYSDYYDGRHELAFVSGPYRAAFGRMLAGVSDNWCALVIQAAIERLVVEGFEVGDADDEAANANALALWRANGMDLDIGLAFTEACKCGEAYLLVSSADDGTPRLTVEHPRQFIVLRDPADRRKLLAALKCWYDELTDQLYITLWTPEVVIRRRRGKRDRWFADRDDVLAAEINGLGEVPVACLTNDPQMLPSGPPMSLLAAPHSAPNVAVGLGRSDLADVISSQDAIDQLITNMLLAGEYAAFKQRWATGLEVPRDAETGQPIEPFRAAVERVWISEQPTTKFGEFDITPLQNYIDAITWHVQSIASRSRIPPHILISGSGNWPSGETLNAAESGLVNKVKGKMVSFGPEVAKAVRYLLSLQAGALLDTPVNVQWRDPERRVESEFADALIKQLSLGVPPQVLWRRLYPPEVIDTFPALLAQAATFKTALGGDTSNDPPQDQVESGPEVSDA
jgi:hypothetical protein